MPGKSEEAGRREGEDALEKSWDGTTTIGVSNCLGHMITAAEITGNVCSQKLYFLKI